MKGQHPMDKGEGGVEAGYFQSKSEISKVLALTSISTYHQSMCIDHPSTL